jgi:hypothetical protein
MDRASVQKRNKILIFKYKYFHNLYHAKIFSSC